MSGAPYICACCGADLNYVNEQSSSQLYAPADGPFILCAPCGDDENDAVERAGTNDLPHLVEKYRQTIKEYWR